MIGIGRPRPSRCNFFHSSLVLFACLRLTTRHTLARTLLSDNVRTTVTCRAIAANSNQLPLLAPVDIVTKQLSIRFKTHCLRHRRNKQNILLKKLPKISPKLIMVLNNNIINARTTGVTLNVKTEMRVVSVGMSHLTCLRALFNSQIRLLCDDPHRVRVSIPRTSLLVKTILIPNHGTPILISGRLITRVGPNSMVISISISRNNYVRALQPASRDRPACVRSKIIRFKIAGVPNTIP